MGYSWNTSIVKSEYITDDFFYEFFEVSDYILKNHCTSDFSSNRSSNYGHCASDNSSVNGSYAGGCSSNNSSVESSKYSSKCVNTYNGRVNTSYQSSN